MVAETPPIDPRTAIARRYAYDIKRYLEIQTGRTYTTDQLLSSPEFRHEVYSAVESEGLPVDGFDFREIFPGNSGQEHGFVFSGATLFSDINQI